MSELTITFNSSTDTTKGVRTLLVERPITPAIQHHLESIPGRPGNYLYPQPLGSRVITVTIGLIESSWANWASRLRTVAGWLYTTARAQLIISDESDRYWNAIVLPGGQIDIEDRLLQLGSAEVQFDCDPYANSTTLHTETWSTNTTNPKSLTNAGTVDTDLAITMTIRAGGATNPSMAAGGKTITYTGSMTAGQVWVVNSATFTSTLDGTSVLSATSGDWPVLPSGANNVTWAASSGHADVSTSWRDRWL